MQARGQRICNQGSDLQKVELVARVLFTLLVTKLNVSIYACLVKFNSLRNDN